LSGWAGFADAEAARFFGRPGGVSVDRIAEMLVPWPAKKAETLYLKAFRAVADTMAAEPA
jgi:hypothetical protein